LQRVAVVTGASSGLGAELARRLAARGWRCVLVARREDRLRELAAAIDGEYEVCDVAERDQVEGLAARVLERHPQIGMLVNNAGIPARTGNFLTIEPELLERVFAVNFFAGVWMTRALMPGLEAAAPSHLVNMVSVAGTMAIGPYSASKHAQIAFSRTLAGQLRPRGIRVLTVKPGYVETEGFPQRERMGGLARRFVVDPPLVADRVVKAIERGHGELTVPRWYWLGSLAAALAPGLLARFGTGSLAR
jgi:NAD(P)-dependent dehydrogenase (short-subunit alcohol dehydrogenase family)